MCNVFEASFSYIYQKERERIYNNETNFEEIVVTRITSEYNSVGIGTNKHFLFLFYQ